MPCGPLQAEMPAPGSGYRHAVGIDLTLGPHWPDEKRWTAGSDTPKGWARIDMTDVAFRVAPTAGTRLWLKGLAYSYYAFITRSGGRHAGAGGRPSSARRGRERDSRPQVA